MGQPIAVRGGYAPGPSPKLSRAQQAKLAALVERGPLPAVDGVVRWRACDLVQWIYQEFGISDDTVYRLLKRLGFSHMSARPRAYKQDAEAIAAFKKTSPRAWSVARRSPARRSKSGSRTR